MRKLFFFMLTSLDGYFEGPNADISWHNTDDEFNQFAIDQLEELDTLLFGRVTYEGMASFWPTEFALQTDPIIAEKMNRLPKYVFSKSLQSADWNNTTLVKENIPEAIAQLKQQPGKDIGIFGSSDFAVTLIPHGLIDEFRIMVNPVVLGQGKPLFHGIQHKLNLKLLKTKTFHNSNVLLYYAPL